MQVLYERCAGLEVQQKTVVATILLTATNGHTTQVTQTFGTMTVDLLALDSWLEEHQVSHVALESTGVYWFPVYNLLEEGRPLILVNPQHMKAVPGRKTDVKASFIPPRPIRELRELTRYRKRLVQERTQAVNRLQKVLESANIKVGTLATDLLGVSGRAMLEALIADEQTPEQMANLARGRMRSRIPALRQALQGRVTAHHRFLLRRMLTHIDFLEQAIGQVQAQIDYQLAPYQEAVDLLQTIPSISALSASAIVAEIGVDMSCFPSAKHLASWAGVCPGNKQSGGKRLQAGISPGNRWLRGALGEVAWAISRTKENYLVAQYQRIARRRGKYKAIIALAHTVLTIICHLLSDKQPYSDLGADYFDKLETSRLERHHVRRLEQLGYSVTLTPASA